MHQIQRFSKDANNLHSKLKRKLITRMKHLKIVKKVIKMKILGSHDCYYLTIHSIKNKETQLVLINIQEK